MRVRKEPSLCFAGVGPGTTEDFGLIVVVLLLPPLSPLGALERTLLLLLVVEVDCELLVLELLDGEAELLVVELLELLVVELLELLVLELLELLVLELTEEPLEFELLIDPLLFMLLLLEEL